MSQTNENTAGNDEADGHSGAEQLGAPSAIILLLVAMTPAVFATGFSNYELVKELGLHAGAAIAVGIWGVWLLRRQSLSVRAGRATAVLVAFAGYALAASLWAGNIPAGLWEGLHLVALAGVALVVAAPVGRRLGFFDLAAACAVGAGVSGLFGMLDLAGVEVFTVVWDPAGPTGAFDAAEFAVAYYAVVLPLLGAALVRFSGRSRILFGCAILLAGAHLGLLGGWDALALVAGACAVATAVVVGLRGAHASSTAAAAVVTVGVAAVLLAAGQAIGERPIVERPETTAAVTNLPRLRHSRDQVVGRSHGYDLFGNTVFAADRTESVHTNVARSYLLDVGVSLAASRPIVGHGAGSWWSLQTRHIEADSPLVVGLFDRYPAFHSPHNGAVKLLVEYGAVGLGLFLVWVGAVVWVGVDALRDRPGEPRPDAASCVELWGMLAAVLSGAVFVLVTPLLELAPAAATWVGAAAVLAGSPPRVDGRGWSQSWVIGGSGAGAGRIWAGVAAILVGVLMIVVAFFQAGAGYYRGRGDQNMLRSRQPAAIEAYRQAATWYPGQGGVALNIALASSRTGHLADATDAVDQAVELRPWDVRALLIAGRVQLGHAERQAALELSRRAVAAYPNSIGAQDLLVTALQVDGRYDEAVDQIETFLDRRPPRATRAKLHITLGDLYGDVLDDVGLAKNHYQTAKTLVEGRRQQKKLDQKIEQLSDPPAQR